MPGIEITQVIEKETWKLTRVETDELVLYIEETLLVQSAVHPQKGLEWSQHWAKTASYGMVKPEAAARIIAAQGSAAAAAAKKIREGQMAICDECMGKPQDPPCWKCSGKS